MNVKYALSAVIIASASTSFADGHLGSGDPEAGERVFAKCQACHVVQNDAGEVLAGRNGRIGPNLYNIAGRPAGMVDGFRYSKAMVEAGEAGLIWDEANMVEYLANPNDFLRAFLDSNRARSNMAFRLPSAEEGVDVYTYLASFGAPPTQ